jgi:hypothetical protein
MISDLSFHYVGYQVAKSGFSFEAIHSDYGYDGTIVTFNSMGEVENGIIYVQLKASDRISYKIDNGLISFSVSKKDISYWEDEPFPVFLVLFNTEKECAYWIYFQKYLRKHFIESSKMQNNSITVYFDPENILNEKAIAKWRNEKQKLLRRLEELFNA